MKRPRPSPALRYRFRRGKDYALANAYQGEQPRLEFTICLTPSSGWEDENGAEGADRPKQEANDHPKTENGDLKIKTSKHIEVGGEEVYMAGDDEDDAASVHSKSLPHTGRKADPAIYRSANDGDDDGILFTNAPCWNQFSVVLRDKGTLRFVKYVSQAAKGDRWDIKGEVELNPDAFDDDQDEDFDLGEDDEDPQDDEDEEETRDSQDDEDEEETEDSQDDDDDDEDTDDD